MKVFTCERNWDAMMTCIYAAWSSKAGHQNIRLELEPLAQYSLFDEYIHVDADTKKAESVMYAVQSKISPHVYHELAYCSMAYESDVLDNIYRIMILGFAYGSDVLEMVHFKEVLRNRDIRRRLGREVNRFQEFSRFHQIGPDLYVAHIEPKSSLLVALGPIFEDRMPSENWMIVDDVHKEAILHEKDKPFFLRPLTDKEFQRLLETENENDCYTDLWQVFFDTIAIRERTNPKCQLNHFPLWTRKHVVEFPKKCSP